MRLSQWHLDKAHRMELQGTEYWVYVRDRDNEVVAERLIPNLLLRRFVGGDWEAAKLERQLWWDELGSEAAKGRSEEGSDAIRARLERMAREERENRCPTCGAYRGRDA